MADPTHVSEIDDFDRTTVRLYRAALAVGAASLLLAGAVYIAGGFTGEGVKGPARGWIPLVWTLLLYGTGSAVIHLHLYARRIRWAVNGLAWAGAVFLTASCSVIGDSLSFWLQHLGIGFLFATWSAIALKEQFCFQLPLMRLVPWFLGASLVPLVLDAWVPAGLLLLGAGALLTLLASKKQEQPHHYDIGDKSKYEI